MTSLKFNRVAQFEESNRTRKVASVVHKALSQILQNQINDPRVSKTTITEVEVSKDLKHAKVFLTSSESQEALLSSIEQLNRAKAYIRHRMSDQLDLKYIPAIKFLADEVPIRSTRVLELIDQVSKSET